MGYLKMAIDAKAVSFSYGSKEILDRISLFIPDGGFFVFLGKNGSGKTTLLKLLSGVLPYQTGTIQFNGLELDAMPLKRRSRLMGFLPQHFRMVFDFSVQDVVMTGRAGHIALRPGKKDWAMVQEVMEKTGVRHLRNESFTEISGGEQQLVRIARILCQSPETIFLDEPTTHLDLFNQTRVLTLLKELADSGITIVSVLHDPSAAFVYGNGFLFLKNGAVYTPESNLAYWDETVLQQVYDLPLECVPYRGRALVAPVLPERFNPKKGVL